MDITGFIFTGIVLLFLISLKNKKAREFFEWFCSLGEK